jgi:hypothetical protein
MKIYINSTVDLLFGGHRLPVVFPFEPDAASARCRALSSSRGRAGASCQSLTGQSALAGYLPSSPSAGALARQR